MRGTVLIVCTGNLCRSPMAAALARQQAEVRGVDVEVLSAGTLARNGDPAEPKAVAVMREIGLDLTNHSATRVDADLVHRADHVLVMEQRHALEIREMVPDLGEHQLFLVGALLEDHGDIADPIGSWFKGPFRRTRDQLARAMARYFDRLERGSLVLGETRTTGEPESP